MMREFGQMYAASLVALGAVVLAGMTIVVAGLLAVWLYGLIADAVECAYNSRPTARRL